MSEHACDELRPAYTTMSVLSEGTTTQLECSASRMVGKAASTLLPAYHPQFHCPEAAGSELAVVATRALVPENGSRRIDNFPPHRPIGIKQSSAGSQYAK
jgi:hypothetical protein